MEGAMSLFNFSGECCSIAQRKLLNVVYHLFDDLAAELELRLVSNIKDGKKLFIILLL